MFSTQNIQYGNPVLLTCSLDNTDSSNYTWLQITSQGNTLLYFNSSFVDATFTNSYAVFDNTTDSFLYILSAVSSSFACFRTSDGLFLGLFTVIQCPNGNFTFLYDLNKITK